MKNEKYFDELRSAEAEATTIREVLRRGVSEVLPDSNGLEKQMKDRKIKLYLGIDPTSPDLHLGHTVPLRKLRQFQDLGHEVVLLFGTFTGMIGDPSDKSSARVRLTPEEVDRNIATYSEQAGRILDLSKKANNPITIAYNHEWLGKMSFEEVVDLAANFSVQQLESRRMFQKRRDEGKPIWLNEFLYPLMQGWDAVALGVDLEVGGKDQTFNMLAGKTLVNRYLDREKWVMALSLIEDPSGKKMGKTEGNIVNIESWPEWKYESIMTWPDSAIPLGFELLTSVPLEQVYIVQELLEKKEVRPMELKRALAYRVTSELDGNEAAKYAEGEYERVKKQGQLPRRITEVRVEKGMMLSNVLVETGLVPDLQEAGKKIRQGAIFLGDDQVKKDLKVGEPQVVRVGKKSIKNVRRIMM
jgi:tyrosyl-tRNA synthetase